MALSKIIAIGNGSTTTFAVNFALGYLRESDVTARVGSEVDGGGNPLYRTITFDSPTLFTISGAAPANGVPVIFERTIPKDVLLVDYEDGDIINDDNLNKSQLQSIMLVHEVLDGRFGAFDADLDMGGFLVRGVGAPLLGGDAANKTYVDSRIDDGSGNAAIAVQAALDALAAYNATIPLQSSAAASAGIATTQAGLADTARVAAQLAKTQTDTTKGQIDTTKTLIDGIQTNINSQQTDITTKNTNVNTKSTNVDTKSANVDTKNDNVNTQKGLVDTAKAAVDVAKASVDTSLLAVRALYQGSLAADPSTDLAGVALTNKAYYYNTTSLKFRFYNTGLPGFQDNPVGVSSANQEVGQCKLLYSSATVLGLYPYKGDKLLISGVPRAIPAGGVAYTTSGLSISTVYYVYATWNGSQIQPLFSTTAPTLDTGLGYMVRTGQTAATLVGLVITNTLTQFTDSRTARYVRSYFNEDGCMLGVYNPAQTANTSTSFAELLTALRCTFLNWPNEEVTGTAHASVANDTVAAACRLGVGFNITNNSNSLSLAQMNNANIFHPISIAVNEKASGTVGIQSLIPVVFHSAGTGQWAHVQQEYTTKRTSM